MTQRGVRVEGRAAGTVAEGQMPSEETLSWSLFTALGLSKYWFNMGALFWVVPALRAASLAGRSCIQLVANSDQCT